MPPPKIRVQLDSHWRQDMEGKVLAETVKTQTEALEAAPLPPPTTAASSVPAPPSAEDSKQVAATDQMLQKVTKEVTKPRPSSHKAAPRRLRVLPAARAGRAVLAAVRRRGSPALAGARRAGGPASQMRDRDAGLRRRAGLASAPKALHLGGDRRLATWKWISRASAPSG